MSGSIANIDGFADYIVTTNETPAVYIVLVCLIVAFSVAIVAPIACLGQDRALRRKIGDENTHCGHKSGNHMNHHTHGNTTASISSSEIDSHHHTQPSYGTPITNNNLNHSMLQKMDQQHHHHHHNQQQQQQHPEQYKTPHNVADLRIFHGELLAAMKVMATERRFGTFVGAQQQQQQHRNSGTMQQHPASYPQIHPPRYLNNHHKGNNSDRLSAIPSVATTSRLHSKDRVSRKRLFRSRMPWSNHRPIPRNETIQRSVWKERRTQGGGHTISEDGNASQSHHSRFSRYSWGADGQSIPFKKSRVTSGAAGTFLEDEAIDGEAEYYRQRYIEQHQRVLKKSSLSTRNPSVSGCSISDVGSIMPPLSSSVLAPNDAADANDPGRIPNPTKYKTTTISSNGELVSNGGEDLSYFISTSLLHLLDLAEYNYESQRILSLAIIPTISAMAEPLFRLVLVAIISNYIDSDSMVAYVLVILFIRITTMEISGAIADAESNMLQDALLHDGHLGYYNAGQIMQLAIFFQFMIGLPVLLMWYFVMDDVVLWLVDDNHIAEIASTYTGVIIIDYLVRSASRSFILPFYLMGHARFEKNIDLIATVLTVIAIAIVATTNDLSLHAIGWIQVIIGIAKAITKVAYVVFNGWLIPYKDGLLKSWACKNTGSVVAFLSQAFPLFLGSLLELGEWDVLVLCVSYLGGAEVATWAVMGIIWEVFQALTEGLGEASSVRVSFYLTEGLPQDARKLAHKVAFISVILVLLVTSLFLMAGPNISVTLSTDNTIQHLFTELIGTTGLANISMTFAQIYWSLAGAQGRFGFASATILICRWMVILPIAFICIFGHQFDLVAVAGAIAIGYAVAACTLAYTVFSSDWEQLAYYLRDDMDAVGAVDFYDDGAGIVDEVDDEDESSDDDDEDDDESEDDSVFEEDEIESAVIADNNIK